jgi:glycerol-3-phosphate acyltransferase PlsY
VLRTGNKGAALATLLLDAGKGGHRGADRARA